MKRQSVLLMGVLLCSCETFVTSIDETDITRAKDADLRISFIGAELTYQVVLETNIARISGLWSGYFTGVSLQAAGYYSYSVTATTFNQLWSNVYAPALKNLRIVQEKALLDGNGSTWGAACVMEASLMGTAAALWGDIPWREAANIEQFPNPRFESQSAVLDSLLVFLDSAIDSLASSSRQRDGDYLFAPNLPNTNWVRVANSVKARLLLYKKDYAGAAAAALLGIQSRTDDLMGKHGAGDGERNTYWEYLANSAWISTITASNTRLGSILSPTQLGNRNHAKTKESARLARYYSGSSVLNYLPNTSGNGFFAQNAPFPIHTASETRLIAAESYARMGDLASALGQLNGHRANLRAEFPTGTYTDFVASDFDPGNLENLDSSLTATEALIREILEEKFVSLYGQAEAFNELRRTKNAMGLLPNAGSEIPQRFLYPQSEINANSNTPNPIPKLFEKTMIFQ